MDDKLKSQGGFHRFNRDGVTPLMEAPARDRVMEGDPQFKIWIEDQAKDESVVAGYWAGSIGKWRVLYDEWEYCAILEGCAIVTEDEKPAIVLRPGDHMVFRPGFSGSWEIVEDVLKTFVVILR
jgi:uncharacterized cupin superfamily protein